MNELNGKVAVITGSSRGLGLAIARRYAQSGAAVVLAARTAEAVGQAVEALQKEGLKASGLAADVGSYERLEALADHARATFGGLDIWVNNAGIAGVFGPTASVPRERFEALLQTNIFGTYYGSLVALNHFTQQKRGKLINLLGRGDNKPVKFQNAYGSSKTWVRVFTLAMAAEYKASGIGIFAFNPGLVDTDMLHRIDVVGGYEKRLKPLETVMRLWAKPPAFAAEKAFWIASSATDGKTGLVVNALTRSGTLAGVGRELLRAVRRQPGMDTTLDLTTVHTES